MNTVTNVSLLPSMSPLMVVLINLVVLGTVMALIMTINWFANRERIRRNGWTLDQVTPITPIQIALLYVPIIGVLWFLLAIASNIELNRTNAKECNTISVAFGPFGVSYTEE